METVRLIGAASGWGARDRRCEAGPDILRYRHCLCAYLRERGIPASWKTIVRPPACALQVVARVQAVATALSQVTADVLATREPFVVLGGDHACAIGTWSGVAAVQRKRGPWGLLWIDAHMDSHLPETSPSGALHGMPLACLLGRGDPRFTTLGGYGPKLSPAHVILIGVRSFEPEEYRLLQSLGVKIYFMKEIRRRGFEVVFREALEVLRKRTLSFGVSLDLDAIDPHDAPAVGTPVPGGIGGKELVAALRQLRAEPHLLGMEVAEYNPVLDRKWRTASLVCELLSSVFSPQGLVYEPYHRVRESVLRV